MTLDTLLEDPAFRRLVGQFIREAANRVEAMSGAAAGDRHGEVSRLAHQLRGASAGYGFPELTAPAAEVEALAESGDDEALRDAINDLSRRVEERLRGWEHEHAGA